MLLELEGRIQIVDQSLSGNAELTANFDTGDYPGPYQRIGGVPAYAQERHEILNRKGEWEIVKGVRRESIHSLFPLFLYSGES